MGHPRAGVAESSPEHRNGRRAGVQQPCLVGLQRGQEEARWPDRVVNASKAPTNKATPKHSSLPYPLKPEK